MAEQPQQPQVAVPLPPAKKRAVQIGCICMMLSVAMYGPVFATLTAPILESVDAMGCVSLFTSKDGGEAGLSRPRRNAIVLLANKRRLRL